MTVHNFIFSVVNSIPYNYADGDGYSNDSYCWYRGWWFLTSYGIVLYIWFMIISAIYILILKDALPFKVEICGHVLFNALSIVSIISFMVPCFEMQDMSEEQDMYDPHRKIFEEVSDPELIVLLVFIVIALVMWLFMFYNSRGLEKQWRRIVVAYSMLEDSDRKMEELERADSALLAYGQSSRELFWYPVVFLIFGIPALLFFFNTCYEEADCRHGIEFVLTARSLFIIIVFYMTKRNRNDLYHLSSILTSVCNEAEDITGNDEYKAYSSYRSSFRSRRSTIASTIFADSLNEPLVDDASEISHRSGTISDIGEMPNFKQGKKSVTDPQISQQEYHLFSDENNLLRCDSMDIQTRPIQRKTYNAAAHIIPTSSLATKDADVSPINVDPAAQIGESLPPGVDAVDKDPSDTVS